MFPESVSGCDRNTHSFAWLIVAIINFSTSEFGITNKKIILKYGVIKRRSIETNLIKVESISINQGILGRILNYGTIIVTGSGGTKTLFPKINNPFNFKAIIQKVSQPNFAEPIGVAIINKGV